MREYQIATESVEAAASKPDNLDEAMGRFERAAATMDSVGGWDAETFAQQVLLSAVLLDLLRFFLIVASRFCPGTLLNKEIRSIEKYNRLLAPAIEWLAIQPSLVSTISCHVPCSISIPSSFRVRLSSPFASCRPAVDTHRLVSRANPV